MQRLSNVVLAILCLISNTIAVSANIFAEPRQIGGLTEELVNCTICDDGSVPFDLSATFVAGEETLTCQTAYERGALLLPPSNCTFFQNRGSTICSCGMPLPEITDCRLCEDDSPLPNPLLEGPVPGETCAALSVDARRDSAENCVTHQGTVGTYCGCDNPIADATMCRICDKILLPVPTKTVDSGASCGQLEFLANTEGNCSAFQEEYFEACCSDTKVPTTAPTSGASTTPSFVPSLILTTSSAAQNTIGLLVLVFWLVS